MHVTLIFFRRVTGWCCLGALCVVGAQFWRWVERVPPRSVLLQDLTCRLCFSALPASSMTVLSQQSRPKADR